MLAAVIAISDRGVRTRWFGLPLATKSSAVAVAPPAADAPDGETAVARIGPPSSENFSAPGSKVSSIAKAAAEPIRAIIGQEE